MTQTALSIHMDEVKGITFGLTQEEVERIAKELLKEYKRIPAKMSALERKAKAVGKGRLSKYEEQLVLAARPYAKIKGYAYKEKAEGAFLDMSTTAALSERMNDAAALLELSGYMIGTRPFGGRDAEGEDWKGKVVTFERADELYEVEMHDLREKVELIRDALIDLESFNPRGEMILRLQYAEGWKVIKVIQHLVETDEELGGSLADSTYHTWRKEALREFGMLVGLC